MSGPFPSPSVASGMMMPVDDIKRAQQAYAEDPTVHEVCEANGFSREDFVHGRSRITIIELFLYPLGHMRCLPWFPALKEVQLMHCDIREIDGLNSCVSLERLWLNENSITRIQNLERCTLLTELYLYSNNIGRMEGLETLVNLKVLWLMENHIKEIDGLENLVHLQNLSLASNHIEAIGHRLDANTALTALDLGHNRIGSFRDIPSLDRLTNLRSLHLSNPHFGENPVCQLCNYQTYALYHLSRVTQLDNLVITDEARTVAEATFAKKKMYYTMRIKTLKRNTSTLLKRGCQFKQSRVGEINLGLNVLMKHGKLLQRELDERKYLPSTPPLEPAIEESIRNQISQLDQLAASKVQETECIDRHYDDMKRAIQATSQHNISRLMVELQTGGNIRMEEGKTSDVWYESCVHLVKSRFFTSDYDAFGIRDLRVTKVTRIHNRHLRNRFEERFDAVVDTQDENHKKLLEYLFYGEDPDLPDELLQAAEHGFRTPQEYERCGKDSGIPLANSVFICEQPRLLHLMEQGQLGPRAATTPRTMFSDKVRSTEITGRLLIAKVYLGKQQQERDTHAMSATDGSTVLAGQRPSGVPLITRKTDSGGWNHKLKRKEYSAHTNSVYRVKAGDSKQRVWFAFDHNLVLPEYLVEFVYTPSPDSVQFNLGSVAVNDDRERIEEQLQENMQHLVQVQSEVDASDIRSFTHDFLNFVTVCNVVASHDKELGTVVQSHIRERPQVAEVTPETLLQVAGCEDPADVVYLNMVSMLSSTVKRIDCLTEFKNLQVLLLSFNQLSKVDYIQDLPHLTHIDLSNNHIKRVEGFHNVASVTHLELNTNLISRQEDLNVLKRCFPQLTVLNLSNNALCDVKSYKWIVLRRLPTLQVLDGRTVTDQDRKQALERLSVLTPELILQRANTQQPYRWTLTFSPLTPQGSSWEGQAPPPPPPAKPAAPAPPPESPEEEDEEGRPQSGSTSNPSTPLAPSQEHRLTKVTELNLTGMCIRKIQHLDRLRSLQRLNLTDNEISRIEGLDHCTWLEELCLEDNRITAIEGLEKLVNLRKLEVGKNKISRVEGMEGLQNLSLVSMEDNDIVSLHGFAQVQNLMELYIGNNKIDGIKEVNHLRDVCKLMILDLSGNPLVNDKDYRLYTIYNLKRLKVLDGVSIDTRELSLAKDTFAGKMTPELLVERVGTGVDWSIVVDLNLSSCQLKEISLLENFQSLLHLKLSSNFLTDLNGIQTCPTLISVNLSFNHFQKTLDNRPEPHRNPIGKYLAALTALQSLSLEGNQIQSINALQLRNTTLQHLNLRTNELTKLDGLDALSGLRELVLDKNKLRVLDERALYYVGNLRELRVEENMIKTLDGLKNLGWLQKLSLCSNRIADLNELDKLDHLERLREIYMTGNSIARKSLYRSTLIHRLQSLESIDAREVTIEDREKADAYFNQEYYQHPPNVYTDRGSGLAMVGPQATGIIQASGQLFPGAPPGPANRMGKVANVVNFEYQATEHGNPMMGIGVTGQSAGPTKTGYATRGRQVQVPRGGGGHQMGGFHRTNSADGAHFHPPSGSASALAKRKGVPQASTGLRSGHPYPGAAQPQQRPYASPRPASGSHSSTLLPRV